MPMLPAAFSKMHLPRGLRVWRPAVDEERPKIVEREAPSFRRFACNNGRNY